MPVHVIIIPTKRDELFSRLVNGHGDIAAGKKQIKINLDVWFRNLDKLDKKEKAKRK
ncbi:MAG: hypothetical protein JRF72_01615 [Deltaproteobacteria bacterium]|jgi:hypothetical protein|nr:hypothetical protein [Deltaproteobacteria bacterium]